MATAGLFAGPRRWPALDRAVCGGDHGVDDDDVGAVDDDDFGAVDHEYDGAIRAFLDYDDVHHRADLCRWWAR